MLTRDENAEPERGLVTVLFADLAGFTDFCERAGEEAAYLLMQHLMKILREIIEAQGGSVRSFTGDGIMAVCTENLIRVDDVTESLKLAE